MPTPRLALLWHMHQPDYRDPRSGRPVMPWVRLHALRGYRDMAVWALESGLPMTVNFVPSLLDQLEGRLDDEHLALSMRPAEDLPWELARPLASGHPAMWEHPAARRLRALAEAGEPLSLGDRRDLQVWHRLAWVGWSGLRDEPGLAELRRKGSGFTEADKLGLHEACQRLQASVLPLWKKAENVEISASPTFHPILPLVVDARHARRCMPGLPDEVHFAWPEDALRQLVEGKVRVEQAFGRKVRGLWPSEGSVSPEVVELAGRAGFRWLASDEEVLARSAHDGASPYDLGHGVVGLFRDRSRSDHLGFRAARMPPEAAAEALVAGLREGTLVALDGENPWESFADAGRALQQALTRRLAKVATTCAALARKPRGHVSHLHTGSWIGADFTIWIGEPEDRKAWRLLADCRRAVRAAGDPSAALRHVLAAEGSDWFWWFGSHFDTPFAADFDRLFREHLAAAWLALGQAPPPELEEPVQPRAHAHPRGRGEVGPGDSWWDWAEALHLDLGAAGAMHSGDRVPVEAGWCGGRLRARCRLPGVTIEVEGEGIRAQLPDGRRLPADGPLRVPRPAPRWFA